MPYINKPPRKPRNTDRQKEKHRLYATKEWQSLRLLKLQEHPMCQRCQRVLATEVHHVEPFMSKSTPQARREACLYVDLDKLMSLCSECHKAIHKEITENKRKNQ